MTTWPLLSNARAGRERNTPASRRAAARARGGIRIARLMRLRSQIVHSGHEDRRAVLPGIALLRHRKAQLEQRSHVGRVEIRGMGSLERLRNVGEPVGHLVALRDGVDAIEVAD